MWESLIEQGVPINHAEVLVRLYDGQRGAVKTDVDSKWFGIERSTKQGDPISTDLFNAVLEGVMEPLKRRWATNGCGIYVGADADGQVEGQEAYLTNLRFADDVMLVARSLPQAERMLRDLAEAAAEKGLELHMGKTKILSNCKIRRGLNAKTSVDILEKQWRCSPWMEG